MFDERKKEEKEKKMVDSRDRLPYWQDAIGGAKTINFN